MGDFSRRCLCLAGFTLESFNFLVFLLMLDMTSCRMVLLALIPPTELSNSLCSIVWSRKLTLFFVAKKGDGDAWFVKKLGSLTFLYTDDWVIILIDFWLGSLSKRAGNFVRSGDTYSCIWRDSVTKPSFSWREARRSVSKLSRLSLSWDLWLPLYALFCGL